MIQSVVPLHVLGLLAALAVVVSCAPFGGPWRSDGAPAENVLLAEWVGPHDGVPAFDRMDLSALKPALEAAMARGLVEIDAIATNPDPPDFENTIVAMEKSGRLMERVMTYWGIWSSNLSSPEFREVQTEMAPKLSEFRSKITQNAALFARIETVHRSEATQALKPDQRRLVQLIHDGFARNGARLRGAARDRYAAIEKRLAELQTRFANNVLGDEEGYVLYIGDDQLSGLPPSFVQAAAAAADERDHAGQYAITNTRSSMDPFLTFSDERGLREQVWRTYYNRGDNGDDRDNNAIIAEILALRHERVGLLGYPSYAAWRLEDRMAKTPERAIALMEAVWPAALARVEQELADMQSVASAAGTEIELRPWDYRYYAEKVRKAKYDLDSDEVKQYLQLEKLREALFFVAGELFGFRFTPVPAGSIPVYHEDVRVWEVTDGTSGNHVGLWYLDPYSRPGKRSGAWATSYRGHETFAGKRTVLSANNSNFIKGAPGEVVLISLDDARTLFHEFGHALHSLSSRVAYPTLNDGVRDYTEFQSQLLERWLLTDEVIDRFLVHHQTGKPIPAELVAKIKRAATFNQGFSTTEYLASALMDMRFHTTDPEGLDPDAFEARTLAGLAMPDAIVMRHRSPHFGHIFSGEGYSAGYYGYLWADVLTSDAAEAFVAAPGGYYDEDVARKLVDNLFAVRNAVDPAEAYRAFRGRDASIDALMRDRGFPVPERNGAARPPIESVLRGDAGGSSMIRSGLLLFCALLAPGVVVGADEEPLAALGWLAGCWTGVAPDGTSEECWLAPRGGVMLGVHRDVGSERTAFEFLRIVAGDDGIVYLASPGGQPPTAFRLAESTARSVRFENPGHDFPQRILYRLDEAGQLHARVEAGQGEKVRGIDFVWKRVPGQGWTR